MIVRKALRRHGFGGCRPHGPVSGLGLSPTLEVLRVPEDADEQLQGELLYLAVQPLLPGPPAGPPIVQVGAGAKVSQVQLVVQLEALDPAGSRRR